MGILLTIGHYLLWVFFSALVLSASINVVNIPKTGKGLIVKIILISLVTLLISPLAPGDWENKIKVTQYWLMLIIYFQVSSFYKEQLIIRYPNKAKVITSIEAWLYVGFILITGYLFL